MEENTRPDPRQIGGISHVLVKSLQAEVGHLKVERDDALARMRSLSQALDEAQSQVHELLQQVNRQVWSEWESCVFLTTQ